MGKDERRISQYSYRVDISLDGISESYYIGASDVFLNGKQQVISANSDFGHELINYRTIKVQKDALFWQSNWNNTVYVYR